ncbi:MAG: hypothetical protein KGL70_14320, partial [Betaproteobacteria bacterium]|nr:hypothetical protein [Betaproteobacteria bacterium]
MNKRTLSTVVLAGLIIAGCGTVGGPGEGGGHPVTGITQDCKGNVCTIDVAVATATVNGHSQAIIGPVPDLIVVNG